MSALTQCLEQELGNVRTSVSPGGVISNIRYVENGEADVAMAYTNSDEAAVGGYGSVTEEGAYQNISHVLTMNPLYLTIMTRKDSDINSFEDLLGKHIIPGEANSIAEEFFRYALEGYGYTYDDITAQGGVITYASYGEGTTMVQDRNADVVVLFANHPNNNALTLDASVGVRLIPIDEAIADSIMQSMPGIVKATVPEIGVYSFTVDDQVLAIGSKQTIICNSSLSEEFVYNLCKVFYENLEAISVSEERIKSLTPETMFDGVIDIPIHPGAQKFYDEYMAQ
jgi:TRAP transporter TAXI family solute receptor